MLELISDVNYADRLDYPADAGLLVSGYEGSWVTINSQGEVELTTGIASDAVAVWSEGNRTGTAGYTADTANTGKVTVLRGHYRAYTDQYTGSIALGAKLSVGANGKLVTAAAHPDDLDANAVCLKAAFSYVRNNTTYTVIEYQTK